MIDALLVVWMNSVYMKFIWVEYFLIFRASGFTEVRVLVRVRLITFLNYTDWGRFNFKLFVSYCFSFNNCSAAPVASFADYSVAD